MAIVNRNATAEEANRLIEAYVEFAAVPGERFPLTCVPLPRRPIPLPVRSSFPST